MHHVVLIDSAQSRDIASTAPAATTTAHRPTGRPFTLTDDFV